MSNRQYKNIKFKLLYKDDKMNIKKDDRLFRLCVALKSICSVKNYDEICAELKIDDNFISMCICEIHEDRFAPLNNLRRLFDELMFQHQRVSEENIWFIEARDKSKFCLNKMRHEEIKLLSIKEECLFQAECYLDDFSGGISDDK